MNRIMGAYECFGARMLAYVTGIINQELLTQNEYLVTENRIKTNFIRLKNKHNNYFN